MRLAVPLAVLAAGLMLGGCHHQDDIYVTRAWVRLNALPDRPAAAFFTLHGNSQDATLIDVSTDVAIKSEMHETVTRDGVSTMKPIGKVALPADTTLVFKPGGRHVMLFDLNPGIKAGSAVTLTFTFANNLRIEYNAPVIAAGAPAPQQ